MSALTMWLLREEFRCVVFDTFENGVSRNKQVTMSDFASDVLAVADHHGDETVGVFGASFGAAVAMQTALESPSRVAGLVLQHGFAQRRLSLSERMLAAWCRRSRRTLSQFPWRRRIQELNHRRWFPPFDGTRFEFLVESTGSIPQVDLAQKALAVNSFDITNRLGEITHPVLLLRTEGEGGLEARSHTQLEQGLKGSRTEWMHSSGLHPALTHPHRLVKLLKSFFTPGPT
jgi:pimeloyl-ACP methyl ester carboxylesterase